MALARKKRRGFRKKKRQPLLRFIFRALVAVFAFSVLWTLAYRFVPVPLTVPMIQDYAGGRPVRRDWVSLERISPDLARGVIAAEDAKFCAHDGFDVAAIEKALEENEEGGRLRGASTISQQTAKNAFLWPGRNFVRKGLEAYFTVLIEFLWGKERIMEVYLNIAEMGPCVYGAEAAAEYHFGKSAAQLTRTEAARLASILPNPIERNAGTPGPFVRRHSSNVQRWIGIVEADGQDDCIYG